MKKREPRKIHEMAQIVFAVNVALLFGMIFFGLGLTGNLVADAMIALIPTWLMWIYALKACRCAHCGKIFPIGIRFPDHCPNCGVKTD